MFKRISVAVLALASVLVPFVPLGAQQQLDPTINDKIRQEEEQHSQIMRTLHFLTDVYGPRVTGSPSLKAAGEWSIKTMTSWGFTNGHLEPWNFGHPGWVTDHFEVHIVSPVKSSLVVEPLAWTVGTKGTVTAKAFNLIVPQGPLVPMSPPSADGGRGGRGPATPQHFQPTQAQLISYLESIKSNVKGAIVLVGTTVFVPVNLDPTPGRRNEEDLKRQYDPNAPEGAGRGGRGNKPPPPEGAPKGRP